MQVTHQNDHITHAVIGGGQNIEFGISSSAEFFNILSSTLYKDQILAVAREVLCNAWDAHIESGRTHIPVAITFTQDKLIIKDYGNGIHKDDMGLVYGTYGNSTKKNDGTQTGGFGLGCKAPFAYSDHFEVASCHDGVKTIYNLSKSSSQAQGKPGIIPIASFPTSESGLQVTIAIKTLTDCHRFRTLLQRIARNGDMNVLFNKEPVSKLGFDTSKSNYLIHMGTDGFLDTSNTVLLRYGNVIYPVESTETIARAYNDVTTHLRKLNCAGCVGYCIIFQAPPHSITVTPSRESLSMQDHTVKTLNSLFDEFLDMVKANLAPACKEYGKTVVDLAVADSRVDKLLNTEEQLPFILADVMLKHISDLPTMVQRYARQNYPRQVEFRKEDIEYRLRGMIQKGIVDRGLAQTYLHELNKPGATFGRGSKSCTWIHKRVLAPLMAKLQAAGMCHQSLYVYDQSEVTQRRYRHNVNMPPLAKAAVVSPNSFFDLLPYLRKIVVVSASKTDIEKRTYRHPSFPEKLGHHDGFLFYHTGTKKKEKEDALKLFKDAGMLVVDLTVKQEWEIDDSNTAVSTIRKPRKKGLVCLSAIMQHGSLDTRYVKSEGIARTEEAEFVVLVSATSSGVCDRLENFSREASKDIIGLFGAEGVVTHMESVHDKHVEKGMKPFMHYIREKIIAVMRSNRNIHEYWAYHPRRVLNKHRQSNNGSELIDTIYNTAILRKEFGIVNNLTKEDLLYISIWNELCAITRHKDILNTAEYLDNIPLAPANKKLADKVHASQLAQFIGGLNFTTMLSSDKFTKENKEIAIAMLHMALNN